MSNKKQKKVLGRGLDALLNTSDDTEYKKENLITPKSLEMISKTFEILVGDFNSNSISLCPISSLIFAKNLIVIFIILKAFIFDTLISIISLLI